MTQEAKFVNTGEIEKKMFSIDEDDNMLVQAGKRIVNAGQSKTVQMEIEGSLALQYDLHSFCKMEVDHSTGIVHLTLPKPRLIVLECQTKVLNKSNERIQLKQFDNLELELQEKLQQDAINDAMNQKGFYEEAQQQTKDQLLKLLQALKPYGVEIKEIKINEQEGISINHSKG